MASASRTGEGTGVGWRPREPLAGGGLGGGEQRAVVEKNLTGKFGDLAPVQPSSASSYFYCHWLGIYSLPATLHTLSPIPLACLWSQYFNLHVNKQRHLYAEPAVAGCRAGTLSSTCPASQGHAGPNISTPMYLLKRNKNACPPQDLYTDVHSNFICNSPKLGPTQWMNCGISIQWDITHP